MCWGVAGGAKLCNTWRRVEKEAAVCGAGVAALALIYTLPLGDQCYVKSFWLEQKFSSGMLQGSSRVWNQGAQTAHVAVMQGLATDPLVSFHVVTICAVRIRLCDLQSPPYSTSSCLHQHVPDICSCREHDSAVLFLDPKKQL